MWIGLRNVGVLLCHVLLAVIGTAIIEGPFVRVKYPIADAVVRQDYISASYPSEQPRLVSGGDPARRGEVSQIRHVAPGHAGQYGL